VNTRYQIWPSSAILGVIGFAWINGQVVRESLSYRVRPSRRVPLGGAADRQHCPADSVRTSASSPSVLPGGAGSNDARPFWELLAGAAIRCSSS
jgi:hypothetical protein